MIHISLALPDLTPWPDLRLPLPHAHTHTTAGWLTSIRNYRWQFQLIYGFTGLGSQIYIGAGGAIFINTYSYYKRLKYWTNTDYSYTIGGLGYEVKNRQYSLIKLTKNKITVEYYDKKLDEWKYEVKEKGAYPSPSPYSTPAPVTPAPALTRHVRYDRALQGAYFCVCLSVCLSVCLTV